MAVATIERDPVAPAVEEREDLARIARLLDLAAIRPVRLLGAGEEEVPIPPTLLRVLRQVVDALESDQAVAIVPLEKLLTTQQAADLLNVSRPFLIRLLDEGAIPYRMTGSHRRVEFNDLMAYKRERGLRRREGLRRLTQVSQDMGLYDVD